ncbi:MAG: histidine--tRNA ligase [Bacteroides sp.]|nr:MAG: histidine--tRNA ligase [Bacteroides sp.]
MLRYPLPKGIRSFDPLMLKSRKYIFNILESIFVKYGYNYIETPIIENLDFLLKNNDNKLLFKIFNSGNLNSFNKKVLKEICNKGLRYDLTLPLMRYINDHNISFPFKSYQIQKVWRADNPQKDRYREFYQCDIDILGSNTIANEIEILSIYYKSLIKLNINNFTISINHREIIYNILLISKCEVLFKEICIEIDKIDKIGMKNFVKNLQKYNISRNSINSILKYITISDSNEILHTLKCDFIKNNIDLKSIVMIDDLYKYLKSSFFDLKKIMFNIKLSRGLNYYTGLIFEVKINNYDSISIGGGGRYDMLFQSIYNKKVPCVGISFGIERIYNFMKKNQILKYYDYNFKPDFLIVNLHSKSLEYTLYIFNKIMDINWSIEMYQGDQNNNKIVKKSIIYANNKNIRYIFFIGLIEMEKKVINLKDLNTKKSYIFKDLHEIKKIINMN